MSWSDDFAMPCTCNQCPRCMQRLVRESIETLVEMMRTGLPETRIQAALLLLDYAETGRKDE